MNTIGYFEIQSSNPQREAAFYEGIFGWRFVRQEGLPIEYYAIETDSIRGGLMQRLVAVPTPPSGTNAYVCSIEVASFDDTSARILEAGGRVAMAKFEIPGKCWQGYFLDADGNTFGVFEVI